MLASEIRIYVLSCTLLVLGDHINRVRLISGSTAEGTRCSEGFHHGLADSDSNLIRTDATGPYYKRNSWQTSPSFRKVDRPQAYMSAEEVRQLARLVEANHTRLQSMKSQVERLNSLLEEQSRAHGTLESVRNGDGGMTMVPLGSGVQIPVKVEPDLLPVIDIGSGVQIETDGERALEMLDQRNRELEALIQNLLLEIKQADEAIIDLEKQMMELNEKSKTTEELPAKSRSEPKTTQSKAQQRRRKRGTELTLDD